MSADKPQYFHYLPALFQQDALLRDFLRPFEDVLSAFDDLLAGIDRYFTPEYTDSEFLSWLAGWVALVLDEQWDEAKRRSLIGEALDLYRIRGTVEGLKRYLEIYTGRIPEIREWRWPGGMQIGVASRIGGPSRLGTDSPRLPKPADPAKPAGGTYPAAIRHFGITTRQSHDYYVLETEQQVTDTHGTLVPRRVQIYYLTDRVRKVVRGRRDGEPFVDIERTDGIIVHYQPANVTRRDGLIENVHGLQIGDWTWVVTVSPDHRVEVWDRITDRIGVFAGHSRPVLGAAFSTDSKRMLTASADHSARLWDVASGQTLLVLDGHENSVQAAVFAPDGLRIASASADHTARIWDGSTGQEQWVLAGHSDAVLTAAFSTDGARIATASVDHTARVWDANTGAQQLLLVGHTATVHAAAFAPDGSRIVTASSDGTARVWNAADGVLLAVLEGHDDAVLMAGFSSDGNRIVTASADHSARVWGAESTQLLHELKGHADAVFSTGFKAGDRHILTASKDDTVRVWDAASGRTIHVLGGYAAPVIAAGFAADGRAPTDWEYHGDTYLLDEIDNQPYRFVVDVHVSREERKAVQPDKVRAIVDLEKPAHTQYYLRITPSVFALLPMMVGVEGRSRIGIGTDTQTIVG